MDDLDRDHVASSFCGLSGGNKGTHNPFRVIASRGQWWDVLLLLSLAFSW